MSKEELYDHIERYLAGSMEPQERSAFEAQVAAEPTLAAELALHQRMQAELGDSSKRDLREKLKNLSVEFTALERDEAIVKPLRTSWKRGLSIAAAILMIGILIWLLTQGPEKPQELVEDPDPPKQEEIENPETPPIEAPEERIVQEQPSTDPPKSDPEITPQDPSIKPVDELLATTEPNATFENLINRDALEEYTFSVESPDPDATFTASNGQINLAFNGLLETSMESSDLKLQLLLFNNRAASATRTAALRAFDLKLEPAESDDEEEEGFAFGEMNAFFFEMQQSLTLAPGLYYYSLINPSSPSGAADQPLLVGKFRVE